MTRVVERLKWGPPAITEELKKVSPTLKTAKTVKSHLATAHEAIARAAEGNFPAMLKVDEVAALLQLERKSVYKAVQNGEIPGHVRIGRTIRINWDVLVGQFKEDP